MSAVRFAARPFLVLTLLGAVACQTVPLTNRAQLLLIPEGTEVQLGLTSYADILKKSRVSNDPALNDQVTRVGRRIAEAIKERLQQVGIEIDVRSYEWATFYSDIKKGNFHLYSLAWVGIMDPDILYQIFHSSSFPPNGDNRGRYSNPAVDRLLEQGRSTNELAERKRIYGQVQRILAEDLPYVPLWWWNNVVVKKPALENFTPYPDGDLISLKHVALH